MAALHGGLVEAQATCTTLGMKLTKIGCWWIALRVPERHMEDVGEEDTCDSQHTTDHSDLTQNDATSPSSNCLSENVDIHEEPGTKSSILQYEL